MSTLQGPVQHLGVLVNSMSDIVCHSLSRRAFFHRQNWAILTQDNWVLQTVQGYLIDFTHSPHLSSHISHPNSPTSGQTCPGDSGGTRTPIERGSRGILPMHRKLCLPNISGQKEGRGTTLSIKYEGFKSVCTGGTLQDGGSTPPTRSVTTRGLDDQNGSKRCLFPNPHTPESPALPPVCLGREMLQVSESPLWPVICTTSIYQNLETSGGPVKTDGLAPDSKSGRHDIHACQQGPTRGNDTTTMQIV